MLEPDVILAVDYKFNVTGKEYRLAIDPFPVNQTFQETYDVLHGAGQIGFPLVPSTSAPEAPYSSAGMSSGLRAGGGTGVGGGLWGEHGDMIRQLSCAYLQVKENVRREAWEMYVNSGGLGVSGANAMDECSGGVHVHNPHAFPSPRPPFTSP